MTDFESSVPSRSLCVFDEPKFEHKFFEHDEFGKIHVIERNGEPWFVAKGVAEILGYSDTNAMTRTLDEDEVSEISAQFAPVELTGANPMARKFTIISESGLYSAILRSRRPEAKAFKKWVTADVLPKLRKTGRYELKSLTIEERFALALRDANKLLEERDARIEQEKLAHKKTGLKLLHTEQIVKAQKPKAEFFDNFARSESNKSLRDAFYALGIKNTNKMTNFLRHGVVDYQKENSCRWLALTSPPKPIQYSLDKGFLVVKQVEDATGKVRNQTLVTPKGFIELARLKKVGLIPAELFVSED